MMIRTLLTATLLLLSAAPPLCLAAETGIMAILSADIPQYRQALDGFQAAVQGEGVPVRERNLETQGRDDIIRQMGRPDRPRLVYAVGPEAAKLAREEVKDTPVVLAMVLRPLAAPNVAWVTLDIPVRVKLEKIRSILPGATRIGVVYSGASAPLYREVVRGCKELGLQAVGREVNSGNEFPQAFKEIAARIDLFLMLPDTKVFFAKSIEYLLVEGMRQRLPVVGLAASYTRAGALLSFEADYTDMGRQAGEIALRIMRGEKPASIEPARPRRVKTSLNLVVAERVGIRIHPQAVREATDVFR